MMDTPSGPSAGENQLEPGSVIDDRYVIKGCLGSGGFATVYRARHTLIDRDVAIKVLDSKSKKDPGFAERFFREAKIAAKIRHPNVVTIYDFGFTGSSKQPYIAMELLEGHDLADELHQNGPLSPERAYNLFVPTLEALAEGHKAGIIHKDLKPANLYISHPNSPRETLRVLDFGVARIDAAELSSLTDTGQLLGTPRYLAPEYIQSQLVTPAIDVYQMALIIGEALLGAPAVDGNPYTAMMCHCNGDLAVPSFLKEGAVGRVFDYAYSVDHIERYQDAGEFLEALEGVRTEFTKHRQPLVEWNPATSPGRSPATLADSSRTSLGPDTNPGASSPKTYESLRFPSTGRHSNEAFSISQSESGPLLLPETTEPSNNNQKKILVLGLLLLILLIIGGIVGLVLTGDPPEEEGAVEEKEKKTPEVREVKPIDPADPVEIPDIVEPPPPEVKLNLAVTSEPPGAILYLDGEEKGTTPTSLSLEPNQILELGFVLDGHQTHTQPLEIKDTLEEETLHVVLEPEFEFDEVEDPLPEAPKDKKKDEKSGKKDEKKDGKKSGKKDGHFLVAP